MLTPKSEIESRTASVKKNVSENFPHLSGFFVFSRISIYYFTGTLANGVLYVPIDGEPILFVRKGLERARQECPLSRIYGYKSYSEIEKICAELHTELSPSRHYGTENGGLTFQLAELFLSKTSVFSQTPPTAIDGCIKKTRSVKSAYECEKMREAGKRQALALEKILPFYLQKAARGENVFPFSRLAGFDAALAKEYPQNTQLTEKNIARLCIEIYTELEHGGMCRMSAHGEEAFYGHVACGENLNQAHYYNGAMGFAGLHPALPCLGSDKTLKKNEPLCVDMLFNYQAYLTDKTQCYFYGKEKDFPDTAKKAAECCQEIHCYLESSLKAGAIPEELWFRVLNIADRFGFSENFMGYRQNAVPFLGHGIGLTVDEYPVIAKGFREPLQNGMFLACEPKIALPGFGMIGMENTYELRNDAAVSVNSAQNEIIFID